MRSVTSAVQTAIENTKVYRPNARLTVYKSRVFFELGDVELDFKPTFAHDFGETGTYMSEAISHCESGFVTVMAHEGKIWLQAVGSDTPVDMGVNTDDRCRPGIYDHYVYYYDTDDECWSRIDFDPDDFSVVVNVHFSDFTQLGAIYPFAANKAFLCYIDNGAIGVRLTTGADSIPCPGRFINPTYVYSDEVDADIYKTHFGGAAQTALGMFFYFSAYDGSIRCVKFSHDTFSDFQISIPSDLSDSSIGNVFSHNDVVHMCFRFTRKAEFSSDAKYTIFTQSKDGITFSLDQRVLVSLIDTRFLAAFDGVDQLIFSSTNRYYQTDAPYQVIQEDASSVQTKLLSLDGSLAGWTAELKSGGEEYYDDSHIVDGAYAKLELGVQSSDGDVAIRQTNGTDAYFRFVTYHDVVVADYSKVWADGERGMKLNLVPDGVWHTSVMTHPFYMEIQGRQGVYDPTKAMDNLYKFSDSPGAQWSLSCDMWADDATPEGTHTHAASTTTDHWGPDLKTILEDYPVFGDAASYNMRLYGWSRAGVPDQNPNVADSTSTSTNNDDFYGLIEVEDENGNTATVVSTVGELASTYKHPPQYWFEANVRSGSDPVVYNVTNPGEGKKIKRLGIRVISGSTGATTYLLERVEMPGIDAMYTQESVADEQPFQVVDVASNWALVDTLTLTITSGNATNGNQVEMNYTPTIGKVYAIAVVGDVMFDRGGTRYLQDAHFLASCGTSDPIPTWDRSYPPGSAPAANSSVDIVFSEWPYYNAAVLTKDDVVQDTSPNADHAYLMHWSDPRFENSEISSGYIPFFYSDGSKHKVSLYLGGSGVISNIVRGVFKVYIFESPEVLEDFDYYGGETGTGSTTFRVANPGGDWAAGLFSPTTDYSTFSVTAHGDGGKGLYIRNTGGTPASYRITMQWMGQWGYQFPNSGYGDIALKFGASGPIAAMTTYISTPFALTSTKTIVIPASTTVVFSIESYNGISGVYMGDITHGEPGEFSNMLWTVVSVGDAPVSNQVPSPGQFDVTVPNLTSSSTLSGGLGPHIATNKKGIPQIAFSTRPYSAFNFEVIGRFKLVGPYSTGGMIGLAADQKNFMLGYVRAGYAGIARVRNSIRTNITEVAVDEVEENKLIDVRFWHRDGIFGLEVKRAEDFWPDRGSQFLYTWDGEDGEIATQDDIFHVGVYALIDPPKFPTVGFRSTSKVMGVRPLDFDRDTSASGLSAFPSSGQVDIGGKIYNYTGKNTSVTTPRGPFHLRNHGPWASQYNKDRLGYTYPNSDSVEFLWFRWLPGSTNALDYANMIVASNEGYAWLNEKTLWRVWITTGGALVWLHNRSRWYSSTMPTYYSVDAEKIWVTNGLTGLTPVVAEEFDYKHPEGAFAYLHSEDSVSLHGFAGFSGERDNSIMDLLDLFCRVAGTLADPIGDTVVESVSLDDGEEQAL